MTLQPGSSVPGRGKVHERSKKAVTQCVSCVNCIVLSAAPSTAILQIHAGSADGNMVWLPCKISGWRHPARYIYRDLGLYIYPLRGKLRSTPLTGFLQANGIIPKPLPAKKKVGVSEEVLDLTTGSAVKPESVGEDIEIIDNTFQKRSAVLLSKRPNLSREVEARPAKRIKRDENLFLQVRLLI